MKFIVDITRTIYDRWGHEIKNHPKTINKTKEFDSFEEAKEYSMVEYRNNHKIEACITTTLNGEMWIITAMEKGVWWDNSNFDKKLLTLNK